ncbi:MAG: hypothetical protein JNM79_02610 [Burkholderiales bacterium]|nr:hypothetical protein [Burkholderiales bacterium]
MKSFALPALLPLIAILATGCSTVSEAPLVFGSSNIIGIGIGGNIAEQGGEFSVGYKGYDFAIVPVSARDSAGEKAISASVNGKFDDALSVLGQFGATATGEGRKRNAGLGMFFSTGLASKTLAEGFRRRLGHGTVPDSKCSPPLTTQSAAAKPAPATPNPDALTQALEKFSKEQAMILAEEKRVLQDTRDTLERISRTRAAPAASGDQTPFGRGSSLVFAQYIVGGLAISAAAPQGGADFTLGGRTRNIAVIPTVRRNLDGSIEVVRSDGTTEGGRGIEHDALSVLGQFRMSGEQHTAIEAGLEKFFSTGISARTLADGFKASLCEEGVKSHAPPAAGDVKPAAKPATKE